MVVSETDRRLLAALEDGLPLVARPYAALGATLGLSEAALMEKLSMLLRAGVIRRFGVVVRHRELGYRANAMTVFDVPDAEVAASAATLSRLPFVTLCYRRPRRPPHWPYNLFCMIHGRDRDTVETLIGEAASAAGLAEAPRAVLFSRRRFKQRGARYGIAKLAETGMP